MPSFEIATQGSTQDVCRAPVRVTSTRPSCPSSSSSSARRSPVAASTSCSISLMWSTPTAPRLACWCGSTIGSPRSGDARARGRQPGRAADPRALRARRASPRRSAPARTCRRALAGLQLKEEPSELLWHEDLEMVADVNNLADLREQRVRARRAARLPRVGALRHQGRARRGARQRDSAWLDRRGRRSGPGRRVRIRRRVVLEVRDSGCGLHGRTASSRRTSTRPGVAESCSCARSWTGSSSRPPNPEARASAS